MNPIDKEMDLLIRGSVDIILKDALLEKVRRSRRERRPLLIKAGFDPTAPDLHLGHAVLLEKMRHFQLMGHHVVFLIGDFTAIIGDPSGRSETRKAPTQEQILENAKTYARQVFKFLDPEKTKVDFNSRWMKKMSAVDLIHLAAQYSVARILERDDFQNRYRNRKAIGIHEFLYPLIQGYDSVALRADVELGGTDQKFNLLVGRELQKSYGQEPQVVITMPLLEGTDGKRKMSKSFGNYIALEDTPEQMFGKLMSISDTLMYRYYELLTEEDMDGVKKRHPFDAKDHLATLLVEKFHGPEKAAKARRGFARTTGSATLMAKTGLEGEGKAFLPISPGNKKLVDFIVHQGWTASKSEARRLIAQGAVEINGKKVYDIQAELTLCTGEECLIKVGKKYLFTLKSD